MHAQCTYTYECTHTQANTQAYTYIHTCMQVHTNTYKRRYTLTHIHLHTYTDMHVHTYTHINTHTHTHTRKHARTANHLHIRYIIIVSSGCAIIILGKHKHAALCIMHVMLVFNSRQVKGTLSHVHSIRIVSNNYECTCAKIVCHCHVFAFTDCLSVEFS